MPPLAWACKQSRTCGTHTHARTYMHAHTHTSGSLIPPLAWACKQSRSVCIVTAPGKGSLASSAAGAMTWMDTSCVRESVQECVCACVCARVCACLCVFVCRLCVVCVSVGRINSFIEMAALPSLLLMKNENLVLNNGV
jgi:hypothetical protein